MHFLRPHEISYFCIFIFRKFQWKFKLAYHVAPQSGTSHSPSRFCRCMKPDEIIPPWNAAAAQHAFAVAEEIGNFMISLLNEQSIIKNVPRNNTNATLLPLWRLPKFLLLRKFGLASLWEGLLSWVSSDLLTSFVFFFLLECNLSFIENELTLIKNEAIVIGCEYNVVSRDSIVVFVGVIHYKMK